jgi:hypothetical protein
MLQPLTIETLKKAKASILESPKNFDMSLFHAEMECGTVHCIGGWMDFHLHGGLVEPRSGCWTRLIVALGYHDAMYLCSNIFYVSDWPKDLIDKYVAAETPVEKANVAAEVIDRIIALNELR